MKPVHGPLLFHVGYIKTATTFLQEQVFSGATGELELAAGGSTRAQVVQNIMLSNDYKFDPSQIRMNMENIAGLVRGRGKVPVWSEEMLLGNPPSARYDGFNNARKLKAIYPDARILITIRRQASIALSMYREYVLGGGTLSLKYFIGTGDEPISYSPILRPDFLYFDQAILHYRELFGSDRVLVLPQEMLAHDPARYVTALAEFMACRLAPDLPLKRVHVSEGYSAVALRRLLNRLIAANPTRPNQSPSVYLLNRGLRLFDKLTPRSVNSGPLDRYRELINRRYQGRFVNSNNVTAAMTGLPLGRYGYDV